MKKLFISSIVVLIFSFQHERTFAQDSTKANALKYVNETSEQSDKLVGKKIQQQSLSTGSFEKTNTISSGIVKEKTCKKSRHKQGKSSRMKSK